ncbi:hypothetical protein GCM10009789_11550 [Kribbella sancticallisti]|uniref:Uncharacterized protein n=1 Tax=Kribbella sancticallisti TaxID=460087 RepID=A0ABP4NG66_9ACTN
MADNSAYQLVVASGESLLARDQADIWDSGKVASAQSAGVPYDGPVLVSGTRYHWKVRCWTRTATPRRGVMPPGGETGVLEEADWSGAQWIGAPAGRVESDGPVVAWTFDQAGNTEGWQAENNVGPLQVADGLATTTVTGPDPFICSTNVFISSVPRTAPPATWGITRISRGVQDAEITHQNEERDQAGAHRVFSQAGPAHGYTGCRSPGWLTSARGQGVRIWSRTPNPPA